MRALLTPEIAPRMGIVLFRPGSELMPLFMQGRVLLEPEPERYSSFASGAVPAASQPLADDPAVRAVFRNEAVIRRAGGVECLESWLLREKGCQWPHSDWHSENMTTMRHAPGAIRLCWHCDNQLRDQFTERLESMATDNCARWVLSVVRRDLGFDDSHVVTMPELCWWLVRNDLAGALPESAARKALRLPKPVVPSVTRESDLVPSVPATSIIQDKVKKVLALKVDPESPESFMLRPKRRRWVNEKYLDFFKGEIGKTHLAQELWTQIDNGQLAPDLAEIRTSITDVSNEITQTVNKKLEDQSAAIQQIQKVQVDTNNNLNSMWAVKLQQMQDGRLYIAGIGAGIENTPDGMQSQVLLAADRIAMVNPANGNTKPMFVGQGDQIFMNDVFLKRLTAPTITSGGNPPAFSLTPDGKLTAKNADISGSVNANAGTLNNVTVNENCTIKGMLEATQVRGDFVKAVSKSFPKQAGTWGNTETPNGTVTVTISDDHNFDRQIIIPPIIFNGIAYSDPGSGNNPGGTRYTGYGFEVRKNGVLIASRETKGAIPGSYSAVIDMPSGRGSVTLEFKVFHKGNQWAGNITDCTVIVTKKAASGISIR